MQPGQVWMRVEGDLFIPLRTEAAVLALPLTEMNEFNMVPFCEAQMTSRCSSLSLLPTFFSPAFCSWNPRMCKKTSERILTKTDLSCGLMWPLVFLHPWRSSVAIFYHDHVIVLIMAVYVCVWLSTVGSNKLCFVPWGKYHVEGSSTATEGYVVVLLPDI